MPIALPTAPPTATIANGASLSDAVFVGEGVVVGLQVPAIDSASLTFQASHDGVTYQNLKDATGAEVTATTATGAAFFAAPAALSGPIYLKVRSGTAGAPVNQTAQRLIQLVIK